MRPESESTVSQYYRGKVMSDLLPAVYVVRHGETAWNVTGRHMGLIDLPLTEPSERDARRLGQGRCLAFVTRWEPWSMRTFTVNVLFSTLAVLALGMRPASADDRKVFRYGEGEGGGALIHDCANRWVEVVGSKETYLFEETGRSDDTVELLDRWRDVGLKVHAQSGELRLPGSTLWQPWERGKWIKMNELPRHIRFTPADQKIRLAYFVPSDRKPIPNYEQKIRVVMQVVADLYADLKTQGYPTSGIKLETDAQGEPIVHLIRGDKPARYYNKAPAYDEGAHFMALVDEIPGESGLGCGT